MATKAQLKTTTPAAGYCDASPTGAHHWLVGAPSTTMAGKCKYCKAAREFHPFEDNIGFNNSPKRNRAAVSQE